MKIMQRNAPFGVCEVLPLKGFPEGKVRIRMRNMEFVRVFIKSPTGVREWIPIIEDDHWTPGYEQARNESK